MVATFSPHRDAGGTLHLPSHTGIHHMDANSAIRQLRRSLSRSPSKSSNFSLLTSRGHSPSKTTPYISSPLSPSRRSTQSNFVLFPSSSHQSPFAVPYHPSGKITRPTMRRVRTSPRSPVKRALNVSTDQGNAKPAQSIPTTPGVENTPTTPGLVQPDNADTRDSCPSDTPACTEPSLGPRPAVSRIEKRRSGTFGSYATVSPLKRSDGIMNLDRVSRGSPSAKRRSVHAASLSGEFSIFDNEVTPNAAEEPEVEASPESTTPSFPPPITPFSPFATIPKRSSSLRRSTLQQRQSDRSLFVRAKAMDDSPDALDNGTPLSVRPRMSLDQSLFQPNRDSPFLSRPSPGTPLFASTGSNAEQPRPSAHPLSRTITQSSSSSSLGDDSPTHEPVHKGDRPRGIINFSKSLPAGTARPAPVRHLNREDSTSSIDSFATPENYKLVKPLPAAFMSTGLISKKNRNVDDPQNTLGFSKNMPDTPCKRPINLFPTGGRIQPERPLEMSGLVRQSDTIPPSPFNPSNTRPKSGPFARGMGIFGSSFNRPEVSRRGSFASIDGDDLLPSQSPCGRNSQPLSENDFPPTPTKQSFFPSRTYPPPVSQIASLERLAEAKGTNSSPLHDRFQRGSPRTPQDHLFPDPSGLSISNEQQSAQPDFNSSTNLPATPTGPRDSFQSGKRPSLPLAGYHAPDVDPSLTSRFERVELVGTGEFSQVYRVSEPHDTSVTSTYPSEMFPPKVLPEQVWAVKKSKQPYSGLKDRERRIREVDILKSLTNSDHIISFMNSWEDNGHLYIQTEFCEEGSLDVFLAQVGLKARLDDFRIWKIMLELSMGLKHIHDMGFIHLDLKPANILITFEGVLKIADFGMAARWPAEDGIEGEGDREYIGPEILMGRYDKPADIFSLGLIMFEIAGNVELPDNGLSWQKLRNGDMSDIPSLTWSFETSVFRDASGNPISEEPSFEELCTSDFGEDDYGTDSFFGGRTSKRDMTSTARIGELVDPPSFMVDAGHEQALDKIVRWMISPEPLDRPTADQLLETYGVQFVARRRRAGATVYEGNWGPADEVLTEDAEMIDV
ncbi:protein kinase, membrane associated tyrosine threonine 1 [Aspergillus brasiliensis]|uniref:Protein kinase, membrane associated tyrosine threonine 1 n=1 Tax=Aspergillus brasiliensis TaxID=319629 RepID=A0A9W5YU69_9EURO|nr:protein kinase, membrane associated tyrosine threonine 1 [Aspergillus brasiliensis]GKZ50463.1 protein kinase, membrane associated tyrosine threonine 1 [Aspergillus brasiliensis]